MARNVVIPPNTKEILSNWYDEALIEGTTVFRGSLFGWIFGRFNQHAVTINGTVHLTSHVTYDPGSSRGTILLGHEMFHVEQQRDMGWTRFLISYALRWRPVHVTQGWEHPLEQPAYARAREIGEFIASRPEAAT